MTPVLKQTEADFQRAGASLAPAYTVSQAALMLGVAGNTIRRWSDNGALHAHRTPGGQRRYSQQEIDRFLHFMRSAGEGEG